MAYHQKVSSDPGMRDSVTCAEGSHRDTDSNVPSCSRDAGSDDDSHDWSRATMNVEASGNGVYQNTRCDVHARKDKTDATFSINKAHKASNDVHIHLRL